MKQTLEPISEVSFPDQPITEWSISADRLVVCLTGAYLGHLIETPVELTVRNWGEMKCRSYDGSWESITCDFDPLKEICECEFNEKNIYLRGFGERSGIWTEYLFTDANAEARIL